MTILITIVKVDTNNIKIVSSSVSLVGFLFFSFWFVLFVEYGLGLGLRIRRSNPVRVFCCVLCVLQDSLPWILSKTKKKQIRLIAQHKRIKKFNFEKKF